MPTFLGAGFALESITQIAPATIRVKFTQDPKAVSSVASNDALNPLNYTVSGPTANSVSNCGVVFGDTQSIDLFLAGVLNTGTWSLTVANAVVAYDSTTLIASPKSMSFTVALGTLETPLNPGTDNDDAEHILRKHLNPALKGNGWDALIAAIATGEQSNWDNAQLAFDQLFKSSASGIYLERKAADDGLTKPAGIGISDELFRQYSIRSTNGKLVENALLDLLEVFYGSDAVRAFADTTVAQPFALTDLDDLAILIDEHEVTKVVFSTADFAVIGRATAVEVAAAITRAFRANGSSAYSVAVVDPQTSTTRVRIYSGALGLASSVRITGGKAQNTLKFPDAVAALSGLPTWTVTFFPATGRVRFQAAASFDASQLLIGDYVNIYGTEFSAANRGSWPIVNVYWTPSTQYFELANAFGASDGAVVQLAANSLAFFRPTRKTMFSSPSRSVIVSSLTNEVDVVLPATSQAVNRSAKKAAYGQVNPSIAISALERIQGGLVTATTSSAHGLSIGDQVYVDGVSGTPTIPPVVTVALGSNPYTTNKSKGSIWSQEPTLSTSQLPSMYGVAVPLMDGRTWIGYGSRADLFGGGVPGTTTTWILFHPQTMTVNADGKKQLVYDLQLSSSIPRIVPLSLNNPGGSQFTNPSFHYGQIVFTGGDQGSSSVPGPGLNATALWTPDATVGTIASWITMNNARSAHLQQTLADGSILVAGGMSGSNQATSSTERLVVGAGAWANKGNLKRPRVNATSLLLKNGPLAGKVLVIGGRSLAQQHPLEADTVGLWNMDNGLSNTDASGNGFTMTENGGTSTPTGMCSTGRAYTGIGSGSKRAISDALLRSLFISGGYTVEGYFNHQSNTAQGPFVTFSAAHNAAPNTNTLFAFGTSPSIPNHLWFSCESGSNVAFTWNSVATLAALGLAPYTWNHFAIVVKASTDFAGKLAGWVYINGIQVEPGVTTGTPTFDNCTPPTSGGTSVLVFGENLANATYLTNNGQIDDYRICNTAHTQQQVWNDYQNSIGILYYEDANRIGRVLASCELYDPATDTWSYTGNISKARFNAKAVELPDGRVLLVGGVGEGPQVTTATGTAITPVLEAEMWNPNTQAWQPAGRTAYGHDTPHVWYLPTKNQVVVTGGQYNIATELFDPARMAWSLGSAAITTNNKGGYSAYASIGGQDVVFFGGGYNWAPALPFESRNQFVYLPNADQFLGGGLNGMFQVTGVPSGTQFQYQTDEQQYTLLGSATGTATPVKAITSTIPGPYILDPHGGIAVTNTQTTTSMDLSKGQSYNYVDVADATKFPDAPGWLVFAFGYQNQVAPVKYFGRLSATRLALDFSFDFPATVASGANVSLLAHKGAFVPDQPEEVGAFYVTASPAGRVAASAAIDATVGSGITVAKTITYPGDRGLGGEGLPAKGATKLSDKVAVWGSDDLDAEITALREED